MSVRSVTTALLACAVFSANAQEFSFSGYLKSYALYQDDIDVAGSTLALDESFQSQNALRLMTNYFSSNAGNIELHYEIQPLYSSNSQLFSGEFIGGTFASGNNRYRYKDLNQVLTDNGDDTFVLQNLDRFNYQYSTSHGDLTIGRQVVSFGSARFINPTDIFIPFNIQTLNQEYRIGIDAVRYQAALGDFSTLDAGIIIGEDADKENMAAFLRYKNSISGNDIETIAIYLDDAFLIGGGIERAIGDFGFWFETAFMSGRDKESTQASLLNEPDFNAQFTQQYWRTSIGSDYAVDDDIIIMVEYHYNGAGSNNTNDYVNSPSQAPYQKAGLFLLGEHYLIPSVSYLITPLSSLNTAAFINLSDQSVFISAVMETSWTDNLYSDFGAYIGIGDGLSSSTTQPVIIGSEFGSFPTSIYASLRYYF